MEQIAFEHGYADVLSACWVGVACPACTAEVRPGIGAQSKLEQVSLCS